MRANVPTPQSADPSDHCALISLTFAGRRHKENQDRVLARAIRWKPAPLYLLAVADGVSQCRFGARVAHYLIEHHLAQDEIVCPGRGDLGEQFHRYLQHLNRAFYEKFADRHDMLASGSTLSTALLHGDAAHCYWVGDSPIYWSRRTAAGYSTTRISRPDKAGQMLTDCFGGYAPFRLKHAHLKISPGDIVTVTSDGVVQDPELINALYQRLGFGQAFLREIRALARRGHWPDDLSVAACQKPTADK